MHGARDSRSFDNAGGAAAASPNHCEPCPGQCPHAPTPTTWPRGVADFRLHRGLCWNQTTSVEMMKHHPTVAHVIRIQRVQV